MKNEKDVRKVTFVIGTAASGKTYFINQNYVGKDVDILDVFDYQKREYDKAKIKNSVPAGSMFRSLLRAQNDLLDDIIERLRSGRDVVVEQTLFKAKRRVAYIDKIREAVDASIEVYVMRPSDERLRKNIEERELDRTLETLKQYADEIEFPNPAEGFDKIYEVRDGVITPRMDEPRPEIVDKAREELVDETARIQAEDDEKRRKQELLESMNTRPFWHYCEACGKKEYLTAQEAFEGGWDYPPSMRYVFGVLGPRTCGDCTLVGTLYLKVMTSHKPPIIVESELTPKELETWRRIKGEPESLLD